MQYIKPENALQKAEDLERVGKEAEALTTLGSIICNRKYRTWTLTHEEIMEKYIDLAVTLRWKYVKKEFVQYRMICQQANAINVQSLAKIVRLFQEKSERAAEEVLKTMRPAVTEETPDDLEETPESIMLQAVSGEDSKERQDRQLATPIIKFLWETYRTNLEVLRNIGKLQDLYHETARNAFAFCLKYKRSTEFRRLGQILREQLAGIAKYSFQPTAVDLNSPDTQKLYLRTRFEQLRISSEMEMWQECYKTIEDIHESMRLSNVTPVPALMRTYYEKLTQIFWASDNHLFHAYSMNKFHQLAVDSKSDASVAAQQLNAASTFNLSTAQSAAEFATCVIVATLVIIDPVEAAVLDGVVSVVNPNENVVKLAALLDFKKEIPTRTKLLQELLARDILSLASADGRALYHVIEKKASPLTMRKDLEPIFAAFEKSPSLSKFLPALKHVVVLKLLSQLSQVYKTMKIDKFAALAPEMSWREIERIIMMAVRNEQLYLRVDHRKQLLLFQADVAADLRMKTQLVDLGIGLQLAVERINAKVNVKTTKQKEDERMIREHEVTKIMEHIKPEHDRFLKRVSEIDNRKDQQDRKKREIEKLEIQIALLQENILRDEELERQNGQAAEREAKKQLEELDEAEKKRQKDREARLADEKKRVEYEETKRKDAKKADWYVRATRSEERLLWKAALEKQQGEEKDRQEADWLAFVADDKKRFEMELLEKDRLKRIMSERQVFIDRVFDVRRQQYEADMKMHEKRMEEKRAAQRVAAAQRAEEERIRKLKEEEEVAQREEEERVARALEEKRAEERKRRETERLADQEKIRMQQERMERLREEADAKKRGSVVGGSGVSANANASASASAGAAPAGGQSVKYVPGAFKRNSMVGGGSGGSAGAGAAGSGLRGQERPPGPGDRDFRDSNNRGSMSMEQGRTMATPSSQDGPRRDSAKPAGGSGGAWKPSFMKNREANGNGEGDDGFTDVRSGRR